VQICTLQTAHMDGTDQDIPNCLPGQLFFPGCLRMRAKLGRVMEVAKQGT